jgi:hypothetical protein
MYIVHETVAGDDPRLHPSMQMFGSFWHYTIRYIPDNENVYIDWLKGAVISEDVAKAHKFTSAVNGELTVKKNTSNWDELLHASSENMNGPKAIYELTVRDHDNCVAFLKATFGIFIKTRVLDATDSQRLTEMVQTATTIEQLKRIQSQYMHF